MVLTLNIGNSHLLIGLWDNDSLLFRSTISTDLNRSADEYAIQIHSVFALHRVLPHQIDGGILSSVVPSLTSLVREALLQICPIRIYTVGPGLKTGLSIRIDDPAQLGAELVCAAVAALKEFEPPLIIITVDTAISIMAINQAKQLLGGVILPSPKLSLDALIKNTAQLYQVDIDSSPISVIGTNTIASMQSGLVFGTACMVDGMINKFQHELSFEAKVVLTGKMPQTILKACTTSFSYDQDLILKGLYHIYQKNRR